MKRRTLKVLVIPMLLALGLRVSGVTQQAPPPSAFASARTVFIASGGARELATKEKIGVGMLYAAVNEQLATWGKYKVQQDAIGVDLSFEVSIEQQFTDVTGGSSSSRPYVRLVVRDGKTNTLLWVLNQPLHGAFREETFRKNVGESVSALVEDLKSLSAGKLP